MKSDKIKKQNKISKTLFGEKSGRRGDNIFSFREFLNRFEYVFNKLCLLKMHWRKKRKSKRKTKLALRRCPPHIKRDAFETGQKSAGSFTPASNQHE